MRSNYVERAEKFMRAFVRNYGHPMPNGRLAELEKAVEYYNTTHKRIHLSYGYGISRCAFILSDYVIKWDYDAHGVSEWGGCEDEIKLYAKAVKYGQQYLLAPITRIRVYGRFYYVMPRCTRTSIFEKRHDLYYYLGEQKMWQLYKTLCLGDLHDGNWGFLHGQPVVFDYAAHDE